ncbi:unnamed protein product [Prorocentrum cordatum]|uniref:Uncharacterized protein n=1 Tax=Prorocentrum cordatum TaxID=2364126 RepID=A0ABN9TZA6_9DINO|nr:unnamed protein product [Polarella glacialis]
MSDIKVESAVSRKAPAAPLEASEGDAAMASQVVGPGSGGVSEPAPGDLRAAALSARARFPWRRLATGAEHMQMKPGALRLKPRRRRQRSAPECIVSIAAHRRVALALEAATHHLLAAEDALRSKVVQEWVRSGTFFHWSNPSPMFLLVLEWRRRSWCCRHTDWVFGGEPSLQERLES